MSAKAIKGSSGAHPIVIAFRRKLVSIAEGAGNDLDKINERIERLRRKSDPPPAEEAEESEERPKRDPRREPSSGDARRDSEIPIDVVEELPRPKVPRP